MTRCRRVDWGQSPSLYKNTPQIDESKLKFKNVVDIFIGDLMTGKIVQNSNNNYTQGLEPATFRSRDRSATHYAMEHIQMRSKK